MKRSFMGKIADIYNAVKSLPAAMSYSLYDKELGTALQRLAGQTTYTGRPITPDTALQISAVWACTKVISEAIGALPWDVYERDKAGNVQRVDHDLSAVLTASPNQDMTSVEYKEAKSTNLVLTGNGYSYTDRRKDGSVISLYPICTDRMNVKQDGTTGEIKYEVNDRGQWEPVPREKIWHVKGFGTNGLVGLSPVGYAKQSLAIASASEEFQARFFGQGARPSLVAKIAKFLSGPERDIARENLNKLWGGLENAHRIQLLEGGIDLIPNVGTMPLVDAQFLQLRGFSIQEICRLFGVPPHMVADLARSTNNNIEQQSLEFVMYCLAPWLSRIEASVSKWLFTPKDRSRFFVRFNVSELLRADATTRAELHTKYVGSGIMSRNEVRQIEKLNRSSAAGMDDYTVQLQLVPIQLLSAIATRLATAPQPLSKSDAELAEFLRRLPNNEKGADL
jgi:HK97 family phage portal protein